METWKGSPGCGVSGSSPGSAEESSEPPYPGILESDRVHRCGERDAGEFYFTLDATNVVSGWVNSLYSSIIKPKMRAGGPSLFIRFDGDYRSDVISHILLACGDLCPPSFTPFYIR
ncbi:MAG: hypothetical protein LBC51_10940 [Treponema sp.]|jgi:hypothetical protein|nr:hypothetical protein [Treponema sp.]